MIRFMNRLFKKHNYHSVYWALNQAKKMERWLGRLLAYQHITCEANIIPDDMDRYALLYKGIVTYLYASLPKKAPKNHF